MGSFATGGSTSWLKNPFSDSRKSREKSERAMEKPSLQGRLRPWTEIILVLISFSKNTLLNKLNDPLDIEK